jgi:hypothetical protein
MPERSLQLDDLRDIGSPEKIASLFEKLGYNADVQPLAIDDLQLSPRSTEAIYEAYLIADQGSGGLQVLLFQLQPDEWTSPSTASSRMRAIASQIGRRETEFLLLATKDYDQLMLVNCRKSFDAQKDVLKASIRKLLIDRTNPTAYDCDRLNEIAVRGRSPQELYKVQCETFDVEKLTKQFYRGYKGLFEKVQRVIKQYNSHPYFDDSERLHQFSQRLLGRMMFLYFLQKKEFLGGERKFLTNQYQRLRPDPNDTDYYAEVLEPLFFDTLNKQRPNLESRWGKIPYLNGGLFDRDYGEGIKDAAGRQTPETIELPNFLFDPGSQDSILGFFNGYNFTISENVQGDEDVAVDPEMLGKVFENMLAAEERGQSGSFYTPRGIVQFMCTEVLSRYLADESEMDLETVKKIIDFDSDQPDSDFNKLMTSQQARKLKRALEDIKVLDPAVGSGAFPLGMMQVILAARQAVGRREGETIKRGSLRMSQLKRDIIANNLYGVDIKPEAIEIAKLRMWLSLVVDIPDIEDVEPLPNLDYKLMCGDSLISTIHGEQLIPDPTKTQQGMLAVTPIQQAIQPLLELQHRYFDAQTEERHELREQILTAEANVFRVAVADRRQYWEGKQRELERKIKAMKGKASRTQEKERVEIAAKLAELDKFALEVESGERALNFFQYHLHFRDVFEAKGGFDVVIGNPPYVFARNSDKKGFTEENKAYFYENYELAEYQVNLYPLFIEKGCFLLKGKGCFAYITPNNWMTINTNKNVRLFILKKSNVQVVNFLAQVFDSAAVDSSIIVFDNHTSNPSILLLEYTDSFNKIKELDNDYFINQENYIINIDVLKNENAIDLITKIEKNSVSLKTVASVKVGLGAYGINRGIPSQTKEMIKNRVYHSKIKETNQHFKYIDGRDVCRYSLGWSGEYLKYGKNLREPRNDFNLFSAPRILVRQIPSKLPYCINACFTEDTILNDRNSMNIINIAIEPELVLATLNSKLISYWFVHKFGKLQRGTFPQFKVNELAIFPIPKNFGKYRNSLIANVREIMSIKSKNLNADISQIDAEIDKLIYQLYDLTEDEIAIVENGI